MSVVWSTFIIALRKSRRAAAACHAHVPLTEEELGEQFSYTETAHLGERERERERQRQLGRDYSVRQFCNALIWKLPISG
jgi:hypothetical protein